MTAIMLKCEVTVKDGNIQVDRIVAVVDCGQVVNPNGVRSQVEGAIVYGSRCAQR